MVFTCQTCICHLQAVADDVNTMTGIMWSAPDGYLLHKSFLWKKKKKRTTESLEI